MAERTTAAMWATHMAELTGCDQTVWVHPEMALPEPDTTGKAIGLEYPDAARTDRGGMW